MRHLESQTNTSHSDLESLQPWAGFGLGLGNTDTYRCCMKGFGEGGELGGQAGGGPAYTPPLLKVCPPPCIDSILCQASRLLPSLHRCPRL